MQVQELNNIGGVKKFWVTANGENEVRVWFAHPHTEEKTVINRVHHRGFVSIRREDDVWAIDRMYSTIRKRLGNGEWGMSGLGYLSDSAYKKVIACCDYVLNTWIHENTQELDAAKLEAFQRDIELLKGRKEDLENEIRGIEDEIKEKENAIAQLSSKKDNEVAEIKLSRAEGTIVECDAPPTIVKTWEGADKVIKEWAKTVTLGTNKVDCWIKWNNGTEYYFVLHMGQSHAFKPGLKEDITELLKFNSGDSCPGHMTPQEYQQYTDVYLSPERRDRYRQLLTLVS